jgi:hypothetical protein
MIICIFSILAQSVHCLTFAQVFQEKYEQVQFDRMARMIDFILFVVGWLLIGCAVAWIVGGASGRDNGARDK